jgi:hypothetical protein
MRDSCLYERGTLSDCFDNETVRAEQRAVRVPTACECLGGIVEEVDVAIAACPAVVR